MASLALASACLDNKCAQIDEEPVRYTDGHTNAERTFYQSSTPDEPPLRFPAARTFRIEHGLRETPVDVNVYLSFKIDSKQSLAAGDEALLAIADDHIDVENNTCADFFLRLTAWTEPLAASAAGDSTTNQTTADGAASGSGDMPDAAQSQRDR